MRAPQSELPAITADVIERIREKRPRVHCITNAVAQNFTANMLLAAGAVPSMTIAHNEVRAFAARADAVLVNLGTFDPERQKAALAAIAVANKRGVPWVLDPVFIDRSAPRAAFARRCSARSRARYGSTRPSSLRFRRKPADAALAKFAKARRTVVGLTGAARFRPRRRAARHRRQRRSADGARHRDGLRRLGAGCSGARGRARSMEGPRRGTDRDRRRGRGRGGALPRARQLCRRNPRRRAMRSTAPRCWPEQG